jgi:hypothetical protein
VLLAFGLCCSVRCCAASSVQRWLCPLLVCAAASHVWASCSAAPAPPGMTTPAPLSRPGRDAAEQFCTDYGVLRPPARSLITTKRGTYGCDQPRRAPAPRPALRAWLKAMYKPQHIPLMRFVLGQPRSEVWSLCRLDRGRHPEVLECADHGMPMLGYPLKPVSCWAMCETFCGP